MFSKRPSFVGRLQALVLEFSALERILFFIFALVLAVSTLVMVERINGHLTIEVPRQGGILREGVVGTPRFINPLLAISDADRDLSSLVYSGLLRATPEGSLTPDLAESYAISEDGLMYSVVLKEGLTFHDGAPITTEDVEFTITKAQDPGLKSVKRANWDGIGIEKISEREIHFLLKQPYAPFLENLTLGILPKHIWKDAAGAEEFSYSPFNVEPIGSGPYKVKSVERNASGIPQRFTLIPFNDYSSGAPYVGQLELSFFRNEEALVDALSNGTIDSVNSLTPQNAAFLELNGASILRAPLPRIFGVFFNQNQSSLFTYKEVREALDAATDREAIIEKVLFGYGTPINGPVPPGVSLNTYTGARKTPEERITSAQAILEKNGWALNSSGIYEKKVKKEVVRLSFSLSTAETPELKQAAQLLKEQWEKIGAAVDIKVFEIGDLNQSIIRPRKYDALLFGEIVGRDLDLYAFWHSSQRNDPGLNIANYTNSKTDTLLQKARATTNEGERAKANEEAIAEIRKDAPAVFLYSPDFIYIVPKNLRGLHIGEVTTPSERFITVEDWFTEQERVWKFFQKKELQE